ncbi:MAG: DUF1622 domain-containing protein [Leptolyngbyaceae cyanobacterium SM2_5_2]|nr:DUF1622 domain-containing protein [Leptolyngbyaceae cyanobacterium SM2_5_2]
MGTNLADLVRALSGILISTCQLLAIFVISVGVFRALVIFLRSSLFKPQTTIAFQRSRLAMGYSFSLGLSFLVGASILKTMLSSQWEDITRLVIIIAVRTALNLLLERAIRNSQTIDDEPLAVVPSGKDAAPEVAIANPST